MANICTTFYVIEGDENDLDALYQTMKELEEKEATTEYPSGLSSLVEELGVNSAEFDCRGGWIELERCNNTLRITTETAWSTCYELHSILKTRYPSIKIYYQGEEPGCLLYVKNDTIGKYFPDTEIDGNPIEIMDDEQEQLIIRIKRNIWNGIVRFNKC